MSLGTKKLVVPKQTLRARESDASARILPKVPESEAIAVSQESNLPKYEVSESPQNLVRYITEDAIKRRTKKDNLKDVLVLDLSLREGEKKIKYLEKLENLTRLQVLHLGHNQIEKIENVSQLTKLRELDLSCNCIGQIEGLETLVHLQVLNISSNLIETIPGWLGKKLKVLREVNLSANLLFSLNDVYKLRSLKDLIAFWISGNPLCDLAHYKLFVIFHLRYLTHLDGEPISAALRHEAQARFAQDEIENFEMQLEKEEKKLRDLEGDHVRSLADVDKSQKKIKKLETKATRYQEKMEVLQQELEAKDELLKRKTAELNKACQKQFRLEQELAFQKIDAKFEPLGNLMEVEELAGGTDESSYIGQAGYKRTPLVNPYPTSRSKTLGDHLSGDISPESQMALNRSLDEQLAEKEKHVERASQKLKELQSELLQTEKNIRKAKEHLRKQEDISPRDKKEVPRHLKEDLSNRMRVISDLKDRVSQLEEDMQRALDMVEEKEKELEGLRDLLAESEEGDPRYPELQAQLADKELQAAQALEEQEKLQRELEDSLEFLANEMERVTQLEAQIREGQMNLNDDLKDELQGIVGNLSEHLNHVKEQAAQQKKTCHLLQKEKEKLKELLDDAEQDALRNQKQNEDLEEKLRNAEEVIRGLEDEKVPLVDASQGQDSPDMVQVDAKIRQAEEEVAELRAALADREKQSQAAEDSFRKQLAGQQRKLRDLEDGQRQAIEDQREDLLDEIEALKAENKQLELEKTGYERNLRDALNSSVNPEEVAERIQQSMQSPPQQLHHSSTTDPVGQSLAQLHKHYQEQLENAERKAEKMKRKQKKSEDDTAALKRKLRNLEEKKRRKPEAVIPEIRPESVQSNMAEEELQKLRDELEQLKDAFQDKDALAAEQLEEKDHEIADLLSRLKQQEEEIRNDLPSRISTRDRSKRKPPTQTELAAHKRLAEAEKELADTKEDVGDLLKELEKREKQLVEEMERCDAADETVAGQQEEIKALYDTLEEQRGELLHLQDALSRLSEGPRDEEGIGRIQDELQAIRNLLPGYHHPRRQMMPSPIKPQSEQTYWNQDAQRRFPPQYTGERYMQPSQSVNHPPTASSQYQPPPSAQVQVPIGNHTVPQQSLWQTQPHPTTNMVQPPYQSVQQVPLASTDPPVASNQHRYQPFHSNLQVPPFAQGGWNPADLGSVGHVQSQPDGHVTPASRPNVGRVDENGAARARRDSRRSYRSSVSPKRRKQKAGDDVGGGLFCNVPGHHHLEDEVSRLEEELHISQRNKSRRSTGGLDKINKSLKVKHKELDALEHDILTKRETLRALNRKEAEGRHREAEMKDRLEDLKDAVKQQEKRREFLEGHIHITPEEEDFLREQNLVHQDSLQDEIHCLEETLAKRRAELRLADKLLHECQTEYQETQDKSQDALARYKDTQVRLSQDQQDAEELEKRVEETAVNLVQAQEHLAGLSEQIHHLEGEQRSKEEEGDKLQGILQSRENEFRDLEDKIEAFKDEYEHMQTEMVLSKKKTDKQATLIRENEQLVAEKDVELKKLLNLIEAREGELESLERQRSLKAADLASLTSDIDKHRHDLMLALHEGESEVSNKQQEIKDLKSDVDRLHKQKLGVQSDLAVKRSELSEVQQQVEAAGRNLRGITSDGDKQKTDLKHTLEMVQIEKTELEALKMQHESRLKELEKTQLKVLQEKASLEKLVTETQKAMSTLNQAKQELERDGFNRDQMTVEKRTLSEGLDVLRKEKELLEDQHQNLQDKVEELKRQHGEIQDNIEQNSHRMDRLEQDADNVERAVKELKEKKQILTNEAENFKEQVKDCKTELKLVNEELKVVEKSKSQNEKELDGLLRSTSKTSEELRGVHEKLEKSCSALDEILQQERDGKERLEKVKDEMHRKEREAEERQREILLLKEESEHEQRRVNKLTSKTGSLQEEVRVRQIELEDLQRALELAKVETEQRNISLQKFQAQGENLERFKMQLQQAEDEKQGSLKNLEERRREIESLTKENYKLSQIMSRLESDVDTWKRKLKQAKQKYDSERQSLVREMSRLNKLADGESSRADDLFRELNQLHQKHERLQQQIAEYEADKKEELEASKTLQQLRSDIRSELKEKMDDLETTRMEVLEEISELADEKGKLEAALIAKTGSPFYPRRSQGDENKHQNFLAEQNKLRSQIQQRMSKQADLLEERKQNTMTSLDGLHQKMQRLEELMKTRSATVSRDRNFRNIENELIESSSRRKDSSSTDEVGSSDEETRDDGSKRTTNPSQTEHHPSSHSYSVHRRARSPSSGQRSVHWSNFVQSLNEAKEEAAMELRGKGKPDL